MADVTGYTLPGHEETYMYADAKVRSYGLGGMPSITIDSVEALDNCTNGGWYFFTRVGSTIGNVYMNHASVFVHPYNDGRCVQELRPLNSNTVLTRFFYNNTWSEWECENPPMALGVEYRTTERFMGKPVYRMLFDFGTMPNKTYKTMSYYPTWDAVQPVLAVGILNSGGTHTIFPTANYSGTAGEISLKVQSNNITISASSDIDMSGKTAYVDVKYIYK